MKHPPPRQTRKRNRTLVPVMRSEPAPEPQVELIERNKWSYPVNPMSIGMDWGRRGYTCDRIADPPDAEWRDFEHETNELVGLFKMPIGCDVRLEIEIEVEGAVQRLDAMTGDEVFVPRGANHTVRNMHRGVTRWLYGYQTKDRGFGSF